MYYVLHTFNTRSLQIVQSTRKSFAEFYGKVLFECEDPTLANDVLRSYRLPEKHFIPPARFTVAQLTKIKKARKHLGRISND